MLLAGDLLGYQSEYLSLQKLMLCPMIPLGLTQNQTKANLQRILNMALGGNKAVVSSEFI